MFLLLFFPQQSQEDNQADSWDLHCYDCLYPTPLTAVALDLLPGDKWTNGTSMERCNFAEVVSKEDMLHGYKYFIFVFWLTFLYFFKKKKNKKSEGSKHSYPAIYWTSQGHLTWVYIFFSTSSTNFLFFYP